MDRHLAKQNNPVAFTNALALEAPAAEPGTDVSATGFRNFGMFHPPDPKDVYAGIGTAWDTQVAFAKLMRRMADIYTFRDGVTSDNLNNFNPKIPAGYTYLAQFAAHDTLRNSALQASLTSVETDHRNTRERSLLLDALYGDGPVFSESLYELPRDGEGFRTMLRTGPISRPPGAPPTPAGKCPFAHRDIPRLQQSDLSDSPPKLGRADVLTPDQRNDDNAIVAQVTALFHHFHNAIVTALRALPDMPVYGPNFGRNDPKGRQLFANARWLTSIVYRRVIREDLLKRLLIGPIWRRYMANGLQPLADISAAGIPLEFSHAAYRLGHAMVRMSYVFNDDHAAGEGIRDVLGNSSAKRPQKFPVTTNWIADWSKFFEIGGAQPQQSRRIGPCFNEILLDESAFSNAMIGTGAGGEIRPEDIAKLPQRNYSGLLLRDLIRGAVGGLLTLDAVLKIVPKDLRDGSPLLADAAARAKVLRDWLAGSTVDFSETELVELSSNPPLIVWLLFEAAEEANGCSLGTLGSIIVGDVFVGRLAASRSEIELNERINGPLLKQVFPGEPPSTMPEVILFTARILGLENADPCFASNIPAT